MYEVNLVIPPEKLEAGYNHVNHAQTLLFMEQARLRWLDDAGFPNRNFIAQGLFLVIAEIRVQYLREVFAGAYTVTVENCTIDDRSLYMDQRVINEKGKECVFARFDFRFVNGATKRSVDVPETFRAFIETPHLARKP